MKVIGQTIIPTLIFGFEKHESIDHAVVEFIKINEFTVHHKSLVLYSLNFKIHKHANYWIAAYEYTTDPSESLYSPPVYEIAIRVPEYTSVFIDFKAEEQLICSPPDHQRRLIIKPTKGKKRKSGTVTAAVSTSTQDSNHQSVYTTYCVV